VNGILVDLSALHYQNEDEPSHDFCECLLIELSIGILAAPKQTLPMLAISAGRSA